jgi:hypothetical protein
MPSDAFPHDRSDFKALVETVADSEKINDPALVEKDYWIMQTVFGLKQLGLTFELCVLSRSLQGIAERPLPCSYNVIQFVCALSRR